MPLCQNIGMVCPDMFRVGIVSISSYVPLTVNGSIILELTRSILSVAWSDVMRNFLSTFQTDSKTYNFYNFTIFTQIIIFHTNYFGIWTYWAQFEHVALKQD